MKGNKTESPKLTTAAQQLVVGYAVSHPFGVYSQRLEHRYKAAGAEAYAMMAASGNRIITTADSPVFCDMSWKESMVARGLRLGIEEFKKKHPEYANELEKCVKAQRKARRNYVEFGVREDCEIPEEMYLSVLKDIGVPDNIARSTLQTAIRLSEYLEEKKEPVKILI